MKKKIIEYEFKLEEIKKKNEEKRRMQEKKEEQARIKRELEKLKKEVKYLIGGEKLVHSYLCNSWKNEFQNNDFVLNNLYKLADEIVYEKLK